MRLRMTTWRAAADRQVKALRRRYAAADVAVETAAGYRRHRLGRNAALLAHYGFLSVFPLLVCFTTILGFVLQGDRALRERIVGSTLSHLPVIGQQLANDPGSLRGNGVVLAFSLLTAIWAGLRAFVVAHGAIDDIDGVLDAERVGLVAGRLRALATISVIGLSQVLTAVAAALLRASPLAGLTQAALLVVTAALDIGLVAVAFQLLSSRDHPWSFVWPGAILAGLGFAGLQVFGTLVVGRSITKATPVYGTFASVIGALLWLALHGMIALVGYQLDVVLAGRAAPRVEATTA